MSVSEKYAIDKARECASVFRTTDAAHPGVQMVMQQGDVNLAGPVKRAVDGGFKAKYGALFMTPAETRAEFERLGWSRVAAFQTRNPMHRSHEYLAKVAIEICDGVLVHSLLGNLKPGDIPAEVRTRAIARADREILPRRHGGAGGLSARHALRRSARGAAARAVPAELRLLAPDRRARPRRRRQLLRARSTRTASSTKSRRTRSRSGRSRSTGRSGATAAAAWRRGAPARTTTRTGCRCRARKLRKWLAEGGDGAAGIQPAGSARRSCASTTPGSTREGLAMEWWHLADRAVRDHVRHGHRRGARGGRRRRVLFVPIVSAFFPFHLDFVRAAGLLIALTSALSAAPSLLGSGLASLRLAMPLALIGSVTSIVGALVGLALPTGAVQIALGLRDPRHRALMWRAGRSEHPEVPRPDAPAGAAACTASTTTRRSAGT